MRTGFSTLCALAFTAGFLSAACSGDDGGGGTVCTPGKTESCPCPGGGEGSQTCAADGAVYLPCECPDTTSGSDTDTTSDSSGSSSESSGGTSDSGTSGGSTSGASAGTDSGGTTAGTTGNTTNTTNTTNTSGGGDYEWLQNDGFSMGGNVGFQGGFVQGECWASTFVPTAYPFELNGVQVLVGPDMSQQSFTIRIYDVDGGNMPTSVVDQQDVQMTGAMDAFNEADFTTVMLQKPVYMMGNFAIAMCHVAHDGAPSIARDTDNTIASDRNWIFAQGLGWVASQTLGLQGDWIMRARITPM